MITKNLIFLFLVFCILPNAWAQVGINTETPQATLQVVHNSTTPAGIIAPRLKGDELKSLDDSYTEDQNGAMVYITEAVSSPSSKTVNITKPGYYAYDAVSQVWFGTSSITEPWYSIANNNPASSNTEDIYQTGKVAIGSSDIHNSAIFQVNSSSKGILIPQMKTTERNLIDSPADGLLIYNTSTGCYNYYNKLATKWLILCGIEEPAVFSIMDCTSASVQGTYTQGTPLNSSNTYTIKINATQEGSYSILGTTGNGYSFSKSGTFVNTGTQILVLEGQGTPSTGPVTNSIYLSSNNIPINPACTLPGINVLGNSTAFTVNCSGTTVHGTYLKGIPVDNSQYIDVPITSVTTSGNTIVETQTLNGVKFSSGGINITPSTNSIRLYAQGTPTNTGSFPYSFTAPGSTTCSNINVIVTSSLGTFNNPADRCLKILENSPTSPDGEYFIKGKNGQAVKTYCDMTNGGYTMIQSFSEKALISDPDNDLRYNQNLNWNGEKNYTAAASESGTIIYRNFLLPLSVRQSVRSKTTTNLYRVRIVENAANLNNNNDIWANNNYAVFDFSTAGTYDFIGNSGWAINTIKITSKLFGKNYSTTGSNSGNYVTFDGQSWNYAYVYNTATARVISHQSTPPNYTFTYTNTNSSITSSNLQALDDIWGVYNDNIFNHHIGKCKPTFNGTTGIGDDYQGVLECIGPYNAAYRTPHSFNDGEGRYVQWFVK